MAVLPNSVNAILRKCITTLAAAAAASEAAEAAPASKRSRRPKKKIGIENFLTGKQTLICASKRAHHNTMMMAADEHSQFKTGENCDVSGSDQKRYAIRLEQFEVVLVGLVAQEALHLICKK